MNSNIKAVQKRQYLFSDDRREGEITIHIVQVFLDKSMHSRF